MSRNAPGLADSLETWAKGNLAVGNFRIGSGGQASRVYYGHVHFGSCARKKVGLGRVENIERANCARERQVCVDE